MIAIAERLKRLPAPGNSSLVQRIMYLFAPVSLVLTDIAGYSGNAPTYLGNLSADTVRALITMAIIAIAYLFPAMIPSLRKATDAAEVERLRKQLQAAIDNLPEVEEEPEAKPAKTASRAKK